MKKVKIYISNSQDVYQNLALEEYLVTKSKEDILLFYINKDCVVIGKHQNPWKEVDLSPQENNKKHIVARRLSGGGTVYHDKGNINFSFIRNKEEHFVNFKEHIIPVSEALGALGIVNTITPRNDIFVNDHKVSGNAEHINSKLKRILHHGTLLYDSDIIRLNGSIRPKKAYNIQTHAVDSVRSPVMNMRNVKNLGNTQKFLDLLILKLGASLDVEKTVQIDPSKLHEIQTLVKKKYQTWQWNFGHTPQFSFTNSNGAILKIRKGKVLESEDKEKIGQSFEHILND